MSNNGRAAAIAVLALMLNAPVPASGANVERGRALYENHCQACHSDKVHGRKQRWPENLGQLRAIVARWQVQQALNWSGEEIDDVVYFLNVTQYNY